LHVDGNAIFKATNSYIGLQNASGTSTGYIQGQSSFLAIAGGPGSSNTIAFYPASTETMRIDSSGRLLVGTSTYAGNGKLIAAGNTGGNAGTLDICWTGSRPTVANTDIGYIRWYSADNSSGNAHYASIYASSDGASSSGSDIPGRLVFSTTADGASSPTERMRITSSGNVGIGTTSPQQKQHIHVDNSGGSLTQYTNSTTGSGAGDGFLVGLDSTEDALLLVKESNSLIFGTSNTERARIDSSGRLLVGTSSARANFFNTVVSPQFQIEGAGDFDRQAAIISSSSIAAYGAVQILAHQKSGTIVDGTPRRMTCQAA
jgi:hypothetical protein